MFDYVVVDSSNLAYRVWSVNRDRRTSGGIPNGLEYGFLRSVLSHARIYVPARVVLVWDGDTSRADFPDYKAGRTDVLGDEGEGWDGRLEAIRRKISPLVLCLRDPEREADEVIARFVATVGGRCLIVSTDKDFHQLVGERVSVLTTGKKLIDLDEVRRIWGVDPDKLPILRAVEGDRSDNIDGIPRIRKEPLRKVVSRSDDLESFFGFEVPYAEELSGSERDKILDGEDKIRRNYDLINLRDKKEPLEFVDFSNPEFSPIKKLCRDLELDELSSFKEWDLFALPNPENSDLAAI